MGKEAKMPFVKGHPKYFFKHIYGIKNNTKEQIGEFLYSKNKL